LEAERALVKRLKADYERRLSALKEKKAEALGRELARLDAEIRAVRKELGELIAQAREKETAEARRQALRRVEELATRMPKLPPEGHPVPRLQEGEPVRIRATGAVGIVRRVAEGRVEVEVKGRRVELPPTALEPAAAPAQQPPPPPRVPIHTQAPMELSVRGMTVEEARRAVEEWLDRLLLAGMQTGRLIHGKGTGTLRRALHEYLSTVPFVRRFHLAPPAEGGEGVTIIEL
ncbi:MAG TPA: hypothetical protein ENL11_00405, partial [Candidatus Acetothermia bacterium]|nr:hypothetical protein [Candidatus Acetothermia bacterium]